MRGSPDGTPEPDAAAEVRNPHLESISDAFFAVDREWRFTYVNGEAERLLRWRRDELLGRALWEEFSPALGSAFEHEYRRATANRRRAFGDRRALGGYVRNPLTVADMTVQLLASASPSAGESRGSWAAIYR